MKHFCWLKLWGKIYNIRFSVCVLYIIIFLFTKYDIQNGRCGYTLCIIVNNWFFLHILKEKQVNEINKLGNNSIQIRILYCFFSSVFMSSVLSFRLKLLLHWENNLVISAFYRLYLYRRDSTHVTAHMIERFHYIKLFGKRTKSWEPLTLKALSKSTIKSLLTFPSLFRILNSVCTLFDIYSVLCDFPRGQPCRENRSHWNQENMAKTTLVF